MGKKYDIPDFKTRLKNLRETLDQTQAEIAEKMGIPRTSLANYEKGTSVPPGDFIYALNFLFDVNIDWFLTGKGEMFLSKPIERPLQVEIPSLGIQIDQRLEELEAQIAEIKEQVAEIGKQLKKKTIDGPDSGIFVSEPEPEYGETEEDIFFVEGVAAGKPIYQSDVRSTIRVPKRYIKTKPEDYYVGRIKGTSMTAAGIPDGCLALFRISDVPRDGAIQIVEWQGEATLKRIREVPGKGWKICFEDGSEKVIEIGPGDEFQIQGDFITVLPEN